MRLYLSSYGLGNKPDELVSLMGSNKEVLIINNAQDIFPKESTKDRLDQNITLFNELGLNAKELDLRVYFNKEEELEEKLSSTGLVWVRGGNAFVLLRAMYQSGFNKVIRKLLGADLLVYGGYSAGSIVATPTLKGVELVDDPNTVPEGYDKEILWDGIGLVDFCITPHFESNHPESDKINEVVQFFKANNISYKPLRDGEVIIIDGDELRFVQ